MTATHAATTHQDTPAPKSTSAPMDDAPTPTAAVPPSFFHPEALVSPGFTDARQPLCLHCGAMWGLLIDEDEIRCDQSGEYFDCPACGARYRARGGRFLGQGASRPERWCGRCQDWRPIGRRTEDDVAQGCVVCGHDFDRRIAPPEQALMDAHRRLKEQTP